MRILLVHNTLNDSTSISGVLREYVNMARAWREEGHEADFLLARAGFPQLRRLAPESRLISSDNWFNATGHLGQAWRQLPAYAWRCLTAHVTRLPHKYDVVYATCPMVVEVYCARVLARRLGVPWVVKIQHVLGAQPGRIGLVNRLLLWGERKSARWVNRGAARVFCLSPPVAADYRTLEKRLELNPVEPITVGSAIELDQFKTLPDAEREFDLTLLGRMHALKGVLDLPEVWAGVLEQRPDARLAVIGEGPHRADVERAFAERGLSDSATFTGGIGEEEKNELLAKSRVGLSLSSEEGWGLAVHECLASGMPVVAYQLPVLDHVFPSLLDCVPQGDTQAASEAIVALLDDPARRRKRAEAACKYIERYDFRAMAKEELEALQAAVST